MPPITPLAYRQNQFARDDEPIIKRSGLGVLLVEEDLRRLLSVAAAPHDYVDSRHGFSFVIECRFDRILQNFANVSKKSSTEFVMRLGIL